MGEFFGSIEYSKAKSFFCSFRGFRPTTPEQGSTLDPAGWLPLDRCSSGVSITHFLTKQRPFETCNERPVMRADIEPEAVLIVEAVQRELLTGRDRQLVGRIVDGLHPMIAPLTPMHTQQPSPIVEVAAEPPELRPPNTVLLGPMSNPHKCVCRSNNQLITFFNSGLMLAASLALW